MTVLNFKATKVCTKCGNTKPDTIEHFYKNPKAKHGLSSECKACKSVRMRPINKKFYNNNREEILLRIYTNNDLKANRLTNIDATWMREHITSKPCFYCKTVDDPRGCDRLDNDLGHIKTNVVPCCKLCNKTRNNHFSPDEMKAIGIVIAAIRQNRQAARL